MNHPHKQYNSIRNEIGSENIASIQQEIKFSKVLTKYITLVPDELIHLGIEFDPTLKIRKLTEKLRNNHKSEKIYISTTLHGFPSCDIDLDLLHFKPQHTSVVGWGGTYLLKFVI